MSELKRFDIVGKYADEDVMYEFRPDGECYDADEVDIVIAELKNQIHEYAQGLYEIQSRAENEIRHGKYKRCLAMSEWCNSEIGIADTDGDYKAMQWYQKWYERWLKIAEQFKEAKCR